MFDINSLALRGFCLRKSCEGFGQWGLQ